MQAYESVDLFAEGDRAVVEVVDDFGVTINPLLLEGQVVGGAVQGIGQALMERTVYDKESGQLLTASELDLGYCIVIAKTGHRT